ncbi:trans-sialidase [Trypanosoma cruzi cruzi]|nr:trans-sialidase [Trypanosoma cruzi cruzi]
MLSRVAAVKAPRTHNRRRVTGFSGRRREGRESEPQRPNMSRRVFTSAVLLLLVVMMCCGTGGATQAEVKQSTDPKFEWKAITEGEKIVESLSFPGLLKVGSDVFAVAEAQCKENGNSVFSGIASQLLTMGNDNQPKEVLEDAKKDTLFLEEVASGKEGKKRVDVSRPTAVVNGSDIYMLAGTYSFEVKAAGSTAAAAKWELLVAVGNVSNDEGSNKKIYWKDTSVIPWTEFEKQHEPLTGLIGGGGSGVKTKDGTIVFPVEGTKKDGKTVSLIIFSSATESAKLSKEMSADGCSDPSVVEWKGKLMMVTACDDGRRRVYEIGDKGDLWTEALGTLSRVWGNNRKLHEKGVGSGFTTATFGDGDEQKNVMLVTLPVYSKEKDKENEKGELHLWLTDNTHIVDIGLVSGEAEDVAASALLYKSAGSGSNHQEELIALYEKRKGDGESSNSLWSVLLTAQLQRVKEVLATWKEVDKRASKLCLSSSTAKDASTGNACSNAIPTDGLVGFLSGEFSGNTWRDEYLGVSATVTNKEGAAKADNGVTFKGRGAWAEWPVGEQGENQLYHFANYNFTLVATVSFEGEPKSGSVPLMGVRAGTDGGTKLMELSYGSGKKWQVLCCDGTTKGLKSTWDTQRQYQVAIVLQNGTQGSVYVDGQRVCESVQSNFENAESKGISHFYIGGDGGNAENTAGDEGVSVTVSNVLLYNRPLTFTGGSAELEEDIASPSEAPVEQAASPQSRKKRETQQVPAALSSHAVGEKTGDGGIVRGSGLLPLLLLLLGLWVFEAL